MAVAVAAGQMLGRYKLAAELGTGSFGAVWLAEDSWLSKRVALKIPHNQTMDFNKLLAEPKLMAALDHPHIIKLLTVEKTDDVMYLVMEFVEGRSLRDRLNKGPLPMGEAVDIARSILDALAHAHAKGVVHRDLKPANILITEKKDVKITDFGTAHALGSGEETVAAGTLYYMPKEQLLGRAVPASDIYSVGVILYEMLTGGLPFTGDKGAEVIQKILSSEPAPDVHGLNPAVPPELAAIVRRALERDLARRFRRAEEMLEALDAWKQGKAVVEAAPPAAPHPAYDRFSKKAPRMADVLGRTHAFALRAAWGSRGKGDGQMLLPVGIAVGSDGRVFVTDAIRGHVQIFSREGKALGRIGSEGTLMEEGLRFLNPTAIAGDTGGRLWVADTKNCRIQVVSVEGQSVATYGRPMVVVGLHEEAGVIGFNFPRGLAVDSAEGLVYVSDSGNNRVKAFNTDGAPIQSFGTRGERPGEFNSPLGLAVGTGGRLYVADSENYRVQVFDRGFRYVASIGRRGVGAGEFARPLTGVAVTANDEVLVCDDTDRMHVFSAEGVFAGHVTGARGPAGAPKYYSAVFADGEDLLAVDENGCQVHRFQWAEKSA